jgi:hypothetical protein
MTQDVSRYEINQKIKGILVTAGADVTVLSFSFSGKTAWFTGRFNKTTGAPMEQGDIETLCKALMALPAVRHLNFEMDDWNISSSLGAFTITRKVVASTTASAREQKPLILRTNPDGTLKEGEE